MAIIQSPISNLHLRRRVSLFDQAIHRPIPRLHRTRAGLKVKLEVHSIPIKIAEEDPINDQDGSDASPEEPTSAENAQGLADAQERAWRTLHADESGLNRIRNEPTCDYNWRRTASEEVIDTACFTDNAPLASGDLRIHVSPSGMQVWAADYAQRGWKLAEEGQAHPTLEDYVLTSLGEKHMPRWVKKHTYASYKSAEKMASLRR